MGRQSAAADNEAGVNSDGAVATETGAAAGSATGAETGAAAGSARRNRPRDYERLSADARRAEILAAVRDLCATDGVGRLSVSRITERAGCTRSLFYHYFPDKEAALDAALDDVIDGILEEIRVWNAGRVRGDIEGSLDSAVTLLRRLVIEQESLPRSLMADGGAALYTGFVHRLADRAATYVVDSTVQDFARFHSVNIDHVYETFYTLICGLIMFIRTHPETPDDTIKDIIAQSLRIEGYTRKYAGHWLAEK